MVNPSIRTTFSKQNFSQDLFASFVVFLIATPLCLGIAIASGVDPIKGIITGIVGGIIVGLLSGAPLQISGPSAGLTVMVLHVVDTYGVIALVPLGIIVGLFQLGTALFKVGHFFQATPPALLKAMLSGIGALILLSQFYTMFDLPMSSNGLQNLSGVPQVFVNVFAGNLSSVQIHSVIVVMLVVVFLFIWNMGNQPIFDLIPGPLVSTFVSAAVVYFAGWDMKMIQLPENFISNALHINYAEAFSLVNFNFIVYSLGFAFIASAETLLCVSAIDKMAKTKSKYNKQIFAQGIGNLIVGLIGAIPVVGVISRSAANLEFGAKSQLSSILLGIWMALILISPGFLNYIPVSALSGLLIYIGIKLLDLPHVIIYIRDYNKTSFIFFTTFVLTVMVDLLAGVLSGFAASILILAYDVLRHDMEFVEQGKNKFLIFKGKLLFLESQVLATYHQDKEQGGVTNLDICISEAGYLNPKFLEDKKISYREMQVH